MSDDPRSIATDASAPAEERYDAQASLAKSMGSLKSQLLPNEDIQAVIDHIQNDLAERDMLAKAGGGVVIPFPNKKKRERGPQSVYLDDLQVFANGEYYERASPLGFEGLREMVEQTPILNAILMTRIRQVSRFCRPQESPDSPGFVVRHVDPEHELTDSEQESTRLLSRFVNNCGWEFNPRRRQRLKRDNFTSFISKAIRDTLSMDAMAIETEMKRDRSKGIDGFYAVDGATIRLCTEQGYKGDDEIFAVQVVQGQVRTAYSYDDLIYVPRNPRTDVRLTGYGLAETELLIRVVTGFLNAMTYNAKGFDENSIPKGILHLSGNYDTQDINAFKRYWNAQVKGINNAWTLPVMVSKDQESKAAFEKFGVEFNEMYFAKWMTFLTSIACAIYSMSPDEINFESFSAQRSSLSGNDTEEKLAASQDKGFRPLMSYLESQISDYIIGDFSDKYVFRFAGLEPEDKDKKFEMRKLTLSLDEARAQDGLEPWPDEDGMGLGAAPINPNLLSTWQAAKQAAQQPQEDFGQVDGAAPDAGGDGRDDAPAAAAEDEPGGKQPDDKAADFGAPDAGGDFGKSLTIYSIE